MKSTKLKAIAFLAACLVAASSASQAAPGTFALKLTGASNGLFKGHAKVAIPAYQINFITSQQATAVSSISVRTRLNMVLTGIDESTMRGLVDEAHADLRSRFEAAGFTVATDEQAQAVVAASGMELVPNNIEFGGGGGGITIGKSIKKGYVTLGAKAAPAMTAYRTMGKMSAFGGLAGKKMGKPGGELDAVLFMPSLTLDFAQMSADTGSGFLGRKKASVDGNIAFSINALTTITNVVNPAPLGFITPGTIGFAKDAVSLARFATVEEGGAAVRVGSMGTIADENYQNVQRARGDAVNVDPEAWQGLVRAAFKDYNAALVAVVKQNWH